MRDLLMRDLGGLPLAGVRIVDLTHDWAGPRATRTLADFGAEVVKVEYSPRMDSMRGGHVANQAYDRSARFMQLNRNKASITLDLKVPADAEALRDLVRVSDVFVENSRKGVMEQLGFGYESLAALKPDIIMVSMTAFGRSGPEGSYAGYGATIEPVSGIHALTGYDRASRPVRIRETDAVNGLAGAAAIMTALFHRQRTGRGQWIDLSELEGFTSALMGPQLLEYALRRVEPAPPGNRHPRYAPQGCYRCRGDDEWVALVVRSDEEWPRVAAAIGRPELSGDPRFATAADRARHHDDLDHLIEGWTRERTAEEVTRHLQAAGIAAGPVLDVEELSRDPHLAARGYFRVAADGGRFQGMPFAISGVIPPTPVRGPHLGEHNEVVLCRLLGRPPDAGRPPDPRRIGTAYDIEAPADGSAPGPGEARGTAAP